MRFTMLASSKNLLNYLHKVYTTESTENYIFNLKDNYFTAVNIFDNSGIRVECYPKIEDAEIKITQKKIKKLISFLLLLDEQPVSIIFDEDSDWIHIKSAII